MLRIFYSFRYITNFCISGRYFHIAEICSRVRILANSIITAKPNTESPSMLCLGGTGRGPIATYGLSY